METLGGKLRLRYKPLRHLHDIRLVKLIRGTPADLVCCIIKHIRLDKGFLRKIPEYSALSYVWGSPATTAIVRCGYKKSENAYLKIPSNLNSFLQQFIATDCLEELLWVDSICINQDDLQERAKQVQIMRRVYAHAALVIVWLGEHTDTSLEACELICALEALYSSDEFEPDNAQAYLKDLKETEWNSLRKFYQNPWFTRIWVFQEVVVARRLFFMIGTFAAPWDDIIAVTFLWNILPNPVFNDPLTKKSGIQLNFMESECSSRDIEARLKNDSFGSDYALVYLVERSRHLGATDPRDRIFALHGLSSCRNQKKFVIDYTLDVREVYLQFARYEILHRQDLHILSSATVETNLDLPSWAPDWTAPFPEERTMASELGLQLFVRAGGLGGESEARISDDNTTLFVKGILLTKPRVIGPIFIPNDLEASTMEDAQNEAVFQNIAEWYQTNFEIAQGASDPYVEGQSRLEAFVRCLVLDYISYSHRIENSRSCTVAGGMEFLAHYNILGPKPEVTEEEIARVHSYGRHADRERRFCLMENGYFGWVPRATLDTDVIATLQSAKIMFVLRLTGPERYRIVGECYLQSFPYSKEAVSELALV